MIKNETVKVLVVVSHPDDEILGCGGTMARFAREGAEIHILILGEGLTSRQDGRDPASIALDLKKLHSEARQAGSIVGAKSVEVTDFPDNQFDSVPLLRVIKAVEKKKKEISPNIIFTHHAHDLNIDHQITFQAVMTACRPLVGETVKEIYSFEVPSSTDWQAPNAFTTFTPNKFICFEESDMQAKVKAMEIYTSEKRVFPHPRSPKGLETLATFRGMTVGASFAEAYEVIRVIN